MYAELLVEVFGKVLGRIYGAVLAACTAETYGQVGKSPFHIPFHGCIYQTIYVFEEYGDFPILFKEADNGLVEAGERLVTFVFARVVYGTAVEYETAAVAGRIFGDTFFIGETGDFYYQTTLLQVVGELFQFGQPVWDEEGILDGIADAKTDGNAALTDNSETNAKIDKFAEYVAEHIRFGSNIRAGAEYREIICRVLTRRAVTQSLDICDDIKHEH